MFVNESPRRRINEGGKPKHDQSVATGGLASARIILLPCLLTPGPLLCGALRLCAFVFCSARLLPLFLSQPCLAAICFGCLRRSSRLASLEDTVAQGIRTCFDAVPMRTVLLLGAALSDTLTHTLPPALALQHLFRNARQLDVARYCSAKEIGHRLGGQVLSSSSSRKQCHPVSLSERGLISFVNPRLLSPTVHEFDFSGACSRRC